MFFILKKMCSGNDGQSFSSADVKFTYDMIVHPDVATPRKSGFEMVSSLEIPDAYTVVVRYREPYARALASWGLEMLPRHLLKDVLPSDLNTHAFSRNPVGTGPYRFVRWIDKQYIELESNPDYFGGKVKIGRYVYRFIPESATRLLEMKADQIDSTDLFSGSVCK